MKNSLIIDNVTADEIFNRFSALENRLAELQKSFQPKAPTEYLTRSEVAKLLKCDLSTIHNWTKKGKLVKYLIGDRVLYKREEVEAAMIKI